MGSQSAGAGVGEMDVTVKENSPKTVIDLGLVFAQMSGIQHDDGLQMSLLGNTNPGLVKTDLSEDELSLTYTASKCGTATVSVAATDADGVSVRENILVTVLPVPSTNTGGSSTVPVAGNISRHADSPLDVDSKPRSRSRETSEEPMRPNPHHLGHEVLKPHLSRETPRSASRINEKLCLDNSFLFAPALDHRLPRSDNSNS
jgi:hypothetical protein